MHKRKHAWNAQFHAPADWRLESYSADEGPSYPRNNKKGDIAGFFRKLQTTELYACTKNIFAPVDLKYTIPAPKIDRTKSHPKTIDNDDMRNFAFSRADELAKTYGWRFDLAQRKRTQTVLSQLLAA